MKKIVKLLSGLLLLVVPLKQVIAATDETISNGKITFSNDYHTPGRPIIPVVPVTSGQPSISDKLPQTGEVGSNLWLIGIVLVVLVCVVYYKTSRKEELL